MQLAQYIQKSMLNPGINDFSNTSRLNFALSCTTDFPEHFAEATFHNNKEEERMILNPEFQKAVATQIVKGIKCWLKSCKKNED